MHRRHLLQLPCALLATGLTAGIASRAQAQPATGATDAAAFHTARRFADLPFGRIAYVERGSGAAALFLHGAPLNGFQWRGALDRLWPHRRCIALDFMGLGYSEVPARQALDAGTQTAMLVALMDALRVPRADIVASDSGCAVAQLLLARHPQRVRSLLLTNGDVEPDSPPRGVLPAMEMARQGTLADETAKWLTDLALARATFGTAVFHDPATLTPETIAAYVQPVVSTPRRRAQYHGFHLALAPNPLAGVEAALKRSTVPARMVWGEQDTLFAMADAEYLHRTLPGSRGIRRVPQGKLFFQEEFPDIVAEEALNLWKAA